MSNPLFPFRAGLITHGPIAEEIISFSSLPHGRVNEPRVKFTWDSWVQVNAHTRQTEYIISQRYPASGATRLHKVNAETFHRVRQQLLDLPITSACDCQ